MDCKELENKLLLLEGKQSVDNEHLIGGMVLALLLTAIALIIAFTSALQHHERLERLEHAQGIDAIGRRVK
jgi:heme/copper-type cytochrome/quinol oxidase subunit 4